jgi:adenylate cyclase
VQGGQLPDGSIVVKVTFIISLSLLVTILTVLYISVRTETQNLLKASVLVQRNDEVGEHGDEINRMIKGLEERIELSKYVSKITDKPVQQRGEMNTEGDRQRLTILFSDIRQFTSFSEEHSPTEVIKTLNNILQARPWRSNTSREI